MAIMPRMQWDLFCRVIDNHGDIGVCWRLSVDLASRGQHVRLWVDDPSALGWMAPQGHPQVHVHPWPQAAQEIEPARVVVEAFGCALPADYVLRMAAQPQPPVWINLEYLSAQDYVERVHGLASPQSGAARGLRKRFYYPGFTPRTGGLIRESDLLERQQAFDAPAWLRGVGAASRPGERVVSLFCYEQPALPGLISALSERPTLLLACAGQAARQIRALVPTGSHGRLRALAMPELTQRDYDHLLWASDLNFVRGEDSLVRAQWAARPFVWQIYPQSDGAHHAKLEALLVRHVAGAPADVAAAVRHAWRWWTAVAPDPGPPAPWERTGWRDWTRTWRTTLWSQTDLSTQLLQFVAETG